MNSRRALSLAAITVASLVSVATSPLRWTLPFSAGPVHVTLDATHPTAERTYVLSYAREARGATAESLGATCGVTVTATISGAQGASAGLRVRVVPASVVASGAASPAATDLRVPTVPPAIANAWWNLPGRATASDRVTVVFERTLNAGDGVVELDATITGNLRGMGELPQGARVTLTPAP